jgi:hypothetical protein
VRDGDMEDVSALIDVNLYSFLSLMGGTTLEEATPKTRFRVARDMGLAALVQTVGDLAGPSGVALSAQGYFQAASTRAPAATLYLYQEKTLSWRPLVRILLLLFFLLFLVCDVSVSLSLSYPSIAPCLSAFSGTTWHESNHHSNRRNTHSLITIQVREIQLRLALLDCLAQGLVLKVMYSLDFAEEMDEAFYYNHGKPTLDEIAAADALRQKAQEQQFNNNSNNTNTASAEFKSEGGGGYPTSPPLTE